MKQNKWLKIGAVALLFILAALPQLVLYYRGYYYVTTAPAMLKYPLNAGCFIGVAWVGHWYLKQYPSPFFPFFWRIVYTVGGAFISAEYLYHFIFPGWGTQTYLSMMSVFEMLVSPMPFIIAWLLLRVFQSFNKA